MKHSDYLKKKKYRETRKKIVSVISAIVVFVTTYALVLPAITLDVSKAGQEPGIAFEQMQFRATASAASVTAADSTIEEVQVEEAAEDTAENTAEDAAEEEIINGDPDENSEEEAPAVSDAQEGASAESGQAEGPAGSGQAEGSAGSGQEEASAAETEEIQEDKSAGGKADPAASSGSASEEAKTSGTQKSAEQEAIDQSGVSDTGTTDAAAAASTEETAAEFRIPLLAPLNFDDILTGRTDFYFYHAENADGSGNINSDSVDDWKKAGSDTVLAPEDFVRVYLSYELPAGALNETNAEARYRLPAGLELSDRQIETVNKYENGIAASMTGGDRAKYLGAEAIEGSRTPDQKAGEEYISAVVKAEKVYKDGNYVGQDLIFTFIPYTVEKNRITYDETGKVISKGREVKGFFTFDLTTSQIDFEKTEKKAIEKEDGTSEEIQYGKAKVVFADKDSSRIERTLTIAVPVENEEPQAQEQKTLTSEGSDYTVTVSYTDDAQIPDNAELAVREIEKDSEEYASYLEQAKGAVDENKSVNEARFFDITILADGKKVEPQAPVSVQITFGGIDRTNTDDTQLLHYKDDKEVEVMDQAEFSKSEEPENEAKAVDTVQFETDGFSVYGIVGTEVIDNPGEYSFEGDGYTVKVNVPEEANIPKGTELTVSEISRGSEEYLQHLGQAWAQINVGYLLNEEQRARYTEDMGDLPEINPVNISAARFFDISFIKDGSEIEPEVPVTVEILYDKGLPASDDMIASVAHVTEHGMEIIEDVETRIEDGEVKSFKYEQESFSDTGTLVGEETNNNIGFDYPEIGSLADITDRLLLRGENDGLHAPQASKSLVPNGDGTYKLSLNVTGASQTSTVTNVTKSNVLIVMDRSSSMKNNNTYVEYDGEYAEGTTFYGKTGDRYFTLDYTDGTWMQISTAQTQYTGTRYRWSNRQQAWVSGTSNQYNYGYIDGQYVQLTQQGSSWYYQTSFTTEYYGQVYTYVTRLAAEQSALDSMVDSLLSVNKPGQTTQDGVDLSDVVEVSVISFGGRAYQPGTSDYNQGTEVDWTTDKNALMTGINNNYTTSGTNWEEAMEYAKAVADAKKTAQSDEDVFVIFLTDGEPTAVHGENGANHYNNVGGGYVAALTPAEGDARALINSTVAINGETSAANHKLYGIFTYGESEEMKNYLKRLINYAYGNADNADNTSAIGNYYFDASDTSALLDAFQSIVSSITDALSYGNVTLTDGMTTDASTSTIVAGNATGFTYTVSGDIGTLYTVTASGDADDPTVTFEMANGTRPEVHSDIYTYTVDGQTYNKKYYYVTVDGKTYKMALADYDSNGQIVWDLGGIGALMSGYTYSLSFTVWPDQDAYDYVAGLNNALPGYEWNTEADTYEDLTNEKGYAKGGVSRYPSIVRYSNGLFAVLTNTDQELKYSIVETQTDEITHETVTTYGPTQTVELTSPPPMGLTGSHLTLTKNWKDALDPSHLQELIDKAAEQGKTYSITLTVYEDGQEYKAFVISPVKNEDGVYVWPSQEINIAPAILVTNHPGGDAEYKTVTLNNKQYYVLNEGHQYVIEETEGGDFHFEFSADPYHPALVDGIMENVSFAVDEHGRIVNGSTAAQTGDVPLEDFTAYNHLTSELDITKTIADPENKLTDRQEDAETFTYKVTLTIPYDPEDPDMYSQYINAYEFVPRYNDPLTQSGRYLIYGYQEGDPADLAGMPDDIEKFSGKVHGRYTVSYPGGSATLDEIFTPDAGGTTQTGVIFVTLKQNEVLRITNLPEGTVYTIQEIYANLRQADPSRDADARPDTNTEASNIAAQGYTVSVDTKNGNPAVSSTATANDTVSGTVTELDTRYYNRFTNTLSDAVAVDLAVTKHLENYEWSGDRYYVKLTDGSNIGRFTDAQRYLTAASGSDDVTYTYASPLRFSEPGEYTFTFTEYDSSWTNILSGKLSGNGVAYGEPVTVTVTVEMVDGELTITDVDGGTFTDTDGDEVNDTVTALITNKVIPISLYKIGSSDPDTSLSGVKFKLYSDENCTEQVTRDARGNGIGAGTETTVFYTDDSKTEISETETEFYETSTSYDGVITTGTDGSAMIGILAPGTYYLQETVTNDGYNLLTEPVSITVLEDGTISYRQESHSPSFLYNSKSSTDHLVKENGGLFITGTDEDGNITGYTITVNNSTGVELPMTGGSGTLPYTLGGLMLVIASALMYGFRLRRRERRLN